MAMKKEALTNLISDDLASRNENWTEIDNTFSLKADKQQEGWQTPTLLNGATNGSVTLQYYKDNMGVVRFKGNIVIENPSLPFVALPVGYRMIGASRVFPVLNYTTLTYRRLNCAGGVNLTVDANSGNIVSLDAVSFRAEA